MAARYELSKTSGGQFLFNLIAANNQKILTSEQYKSKASAKNGIKSCQTNAAKDERYERRKASNGKPYFVLLAVNKQVIGKSQMYASKQTMENGIKACKRVGPSAEVKDLT